MKKIYLFLAQTLMVLSLVCVTGCSKGDDGSYTIGEPTYPDTGNGTDNSVPDPEGTIIFSMANYGIRINTGSSIERGSGLQLSSDTHFIAMTSENNFLCYYCSVASIGTVSGLGNIKQIPNTGYVTTTMSVERGYGYVVKDDNGTYARLYVVDWIISTSNAIIGAKVKYQYPFVP